MKSEEITSAFAAWKKPRVAPQKQEETPVVAAASPIRARLNYSAVGVCPYCNQPMDRIECCSQEVFLCESDRFVAPLPNEELK